MPDTVSPIFDPEKMQARIEAIAAQSAQPVRSPPLQHGGPGGTSGGMEERVTRLETHMEYVRRDLDSISSKLDKLVDNTAALPTRADLNTWRWQWSATGLAIIALTVGGITGGLALIARFAG